MPVVDANRNVDFAVGKGIGMTEPGRAEEALEALRERCRTTLDNMLEGCQIIDRNWRYLYVNEVVARHGRSTREELLGKTMMEAYPGIENTELFATLRRCMEERIPAHVETGFTFPDRHEGWFEVGVRPVPDGILILSIDITERKRTQEALEALRERYRTTLDNMLEGCQIIDRNWRYLYVNEVVARHGRSTREELLGKTMMEAYPGIENTDLFATLRRCMEERIPAHVETGFTFPDRHEGWFEVSVRPVPEGIFVLSVEISERQWPEEVREAETRLQALLEAIPELMLRTSRDTTNVDPQPLESLGLTRRETQILKLLARGRSNRQIAEQLVLSTRTVESHVLHICRKLNVTRRAEVAFLAIKLGLPLDDPPTE